MTKKKIELTPQQISIVLQIINKSTFVGEQLEIVLQLKQTLIKMLQESQENKPE